MKQRYSARTYGDYQLTQQDLASLFAGFAEVDRRRLLPSAGGTYPIEVYAMCFNVQGLEGKTVYYDYLRNSLSVIGQCGSWQDIEPITGASGAIEGNPSILFLFVAFPSRVTSKYGERGDRFLLIEAGHYLQNLSLRIAFEDLKGVELGGLFDHEFKQRLGLEGTDAIITLGMICGK
jgi:SagB-type dehydrogenase family enzyme